MLFSAKYFSITWLDYNENNIIKENILNNIASIITVASIISYYVGDWINDIIFAKLNNNKNDFINYSKRSFISSIAEKFVDTTIFNIFLILLPNSNFTLKLVIIPIIIEIFVEFALLPLNHKLVMKIKNSVR